MAQIDANFMRRLHSKFKELFNTNITDSYNLAKSPEYIYPFHFHSSLENHIRK